MRDPRETLPRSGKGLGPTRLEKRKEIVQAVFERRKPGLSLPPASLT
jgi:hypothetical protein